MLDLRDPLAPRRRGTVVAAGGDASSLIDPGDQFGAGLTVAGDFAYLARGTLGLQVVDIRHPDAPRLAGRLSQPVDQAVQVTAVGDRLYVLDRVTTLQVIQGPGLDRTDTDGDGVIDFFDAFPTDPRETHFTDQDRLGDTADPDDNNDGFLDAEEQQAAPPTDPERCTQLSRTPTARWYHDLGGRCHQPRAGVPSAPAPQKPRTKRSARRSRPCARAACHRSNKVQVQTGTYAALTTQERFPLDLSGLAGLTLHGEGDRGPGCGVDGPRWCRPRSAATWSLRAS